MRILHFADLHLGIETYGRIDPATGLNTRLLDFLRALDELVDYAIEQAIDLVLFCGDLYKGRDPSQTHQRALAERIRRLADAGIPIFLLAGNHDMPANPSRATTIDIFQTLLGASSNAYVHAVSEPGAYMIQTRDGPLQIVALPWPTPAQFPLPPWSPPETTDEMLLRIPAEASGFIADAAAKLDPSVPAILAAHIALGGAAVIPGSEQAMTLGLHPLFYPSQLHPELFDYVALGHLHQRQVIDGPPPIVYAGSLQPVDFGEEGEEKGFYVVDVEQGRSAKVAFVPVQCRRFVTITASPRDANPTPEVLAAIGACHVADSIVRLDLTLSQAQAALLYASALSQALSAAYTIAYIRRHVDDDRHQPRTPDALHLESLAPLEALRLYLTQQQVASERQEVLVANARGLMERTG